GLANYVDIVGSKDVHSVLGNTLWYTIGSLCTILPFAFILALLLNVRWNRYREAFRLVYFLPSITSVIVIGINFSLLYDVRYGILNWILGGIGLEPVRWIESREWFKTSALIMMVWRWVGYNAVYFLSGLQNISPELHEAAEIDGANWLQRLFRITIPLLRPVLLFVLLVEIISNFQLFEDIYILGGSSGGPAETGLTVAMYLYRQGFVYGQMGYASAVGVLLAIIIFAVSFIQMKGFGTFREY
ncbi:MAG: sugar ABC transporter permease, partial [Chloroflexi bacterium]|nr:sugar ABC transporter permease [Chloroflexota bacterium]